MALCSDKVPPICLIITEKTIQVILFPFVNGLLENLVNAVVFEESYLFAATPNSSILVLELSCFFCAHPCSETSSNMFVSNLYLKGCVRYSPLYYLLLDTVSEWH